MASGKTTVGMALARELGIPFRDADEEACRRTGNTVPEMFQGLGEEGFRDLETEILVTALADEAGAGICLATGGGVVQRSGNRDILRERSMCIFLDPPWDILVERLMREGSGRPVLRDRSPAEWKGLWETRRPWYLEVAAVHVPEDLPVPELVQRLRQSIRSGAHVPPRSC